MTSEEKKQRAKSMMQAMDSGDWQSLDAILSDTFEFDLRTPMPGRKYPISRAEFLDDMRSELTGMFPKGFEWQYKEAICEGDCVSLQAVSDTVMGDGRPYSNNYHWFYRFKGDKIDLLRVYLDSLNAFANCVATPELRKQILG